MHTNKLSYTALKRELRIEMMKYLPPMVEAHEESPVIGVLAEKGHILLFWVVGSDLSHVGIELDHIVNDLV